MINVKEKISNSQLLYLVAGFVQGSGLLISFTAGITERQTWMVVLMGLVLTSPFILTYVLLMKRFPGMNIIEINEIIFGHFLGRTISIYYIFFFIMTLSFNIRDIGSFYKTFLMPETPFVFFLIVFTAACAYAVAKGIEVLARVSHLFVFISLFVVFSTLILQIGSMDFSNFLPLFSLPLGKLAQGTHIMSTIPFGEVLVFLIILASVNKTTHVVKSTFIGLIVGGITLLIVAVRNTAILGITETIWANPSFQSVRLIDIGNVFTRMDLLIGIGQTMILYLKCSLFLYALVVALSQLFGLKSYLSLILPVAGIEIILAASVFQSPVEQAIITINSGIIYSAPLIYLIPPLTLLIAKVCGLPKHDRGND